MAALFGLMSEQEKTASWGGKYSIYAFSGDDNSNCPELRKQLLAAASKFYTEFVAKRKGDPALRGELGLALYRLGQITGEADIEITSGVKPGMEIVRGPSRVLKTLKDGMTVKRQEHKAGANGNVNEGS